MRREATSNIWMTIVSIVWVAGSCLESFVAPPANGVALGSWPCKQHATAAGKLKRGCREEGGNWLQGSSSALRSLQFKCPKQADKLELELGHELDWAAQCVRDLSTVAAGAKRCRESSTLWHAAFAYFGGRTGSHLSIGSKRCHKGQQRKQSQADTYVNQTEFLPPALVTRPRTACTPSPARLANLWSDCVYSNQASVEQEVQAKSCSNFHAGTNCRYSHIVTHSLTHPFAHSVVPTLTHPWALNTLTD